MQIKFALHLACFCGNDSLRHRPFQPEGTANREHALAHRQIRASDLPGALGTLERVLFAYPEATPPRLLYASLLCFLDDRQGAELELGLLAGKPIADSDWAGVAAACGPVPRPAPPKSGKRR